MSGAEGADAPHRAADLARDPSLTRLWDRVRRRLAANGRCVAGASVSLPGPSIDERRALQLLLGARLTGQKPRIRLDDLDAALRASPERAGLTEFLERGGAAIPDRRADHAALRAREDRVWREAATHAAVGRHPALVAWLDALRASGLLRREAEAGAVADLRVALDVLAALPCEPAGRASVAGNLLGDAHGLDDVRPVARLVLGALAYISDSEPPARAAERRALWARWGVVSDTTSSRVVALRIGARGEGPVARAVTAMAEAAIPFHVTLAMLDAPGWTPAAAGRVHVCENPAVVEEAALRFRVRCPPMVCVEGMPSIAARRLLGALRASGADLVYHGDFGAGGLRIGNVVIGEIGAQPWRFRASDYEAAVARVRDGVPIRAAVPDAVWDPALGPALRAHRREIHEEQVLEDLLADLGDAAG